jgi:hypothetical protein
VLRLLNIFAVNRWSQSLRPECQLKEIVSKIAI